MKKAFHKNVSPSLPARGWCWFPSPWWCEGCLRRSSSLSLAMEMSNKQVGGRNKLNSLSTILCRSNLSLISLQVWTMWTSWKRWKRRHNAASGPKGLIRTFTFNPSNVQTSENFHTQLWLTIDQLSQNIRRIPSRSLRHWTSRKAVFFSCGNQLVHDSQAPAWYKQDCCGQNVEVKRRRSSYSIFCLFPQHIDPHSFWNQQKSNGIYYRKF